MPERTARTANSTLESERLIAAAYAAINVTGTSLGPPPPTGTPMQQAQNGVATQSKTAGGSVSSSASRASNTQTSASAVTSSRSSTQSFQNQQAQTKTKTSSAASPQSSRYAEARRKHAAPTGQPVAPAHTLTGQAMGAPQSIYTAQSSSSTGGAASTQPPPPTSSPLYTSINTSGKPTQAATQRSQTPRPPSGTPVSTATPPRKSPASKPAPQKKSSSSGCVSWMVIIGIGLLLLRWLGIEL